ncbi:ABC transporter permease [Kocuria sp. JC486]|uniref:ABC transporter permease n=1 Tax=Kocuria sp. JC486 TaxID=1970736 RepID=UPI001FD81C61|nr:ABC transporter permease [Kocuria sp. JC486]
MTTGTATDRTERPTTADSAGPNALMGILKYAAYDFRRQLRMVESLFFIIVLPAALFVMFGSITDYGDLPAGHGTVSGSIATSMAVYGAVVATTNIAGSAAVERSKGWGRLLALTPMAQWQYVAAKVLVALAIAVLPVIVVFTVAALTGAELGPWNIWLSAGALAVLCSTMFALYGLFFGLMFRSEAAVGAASGLLVVLGFFGNLFTPLSGTMLEIAKFTPLYGVHGLATWPQMEGEIMSTMGEPMDPDTLGMLITSVVVWTVIFGLLALLAARRGTKRA